MALGWSGGKKSTWATKWRIYVTIHLREAADMGANDKRCGLCGARDLTGPNTAPDSRKSIAAQELPGGLDTAARAAKEE